MDKIRKAYISMLTESMDDSIKQLESDLIKKHPHLDRLSLTKSGDTIKLDTIIVKKEHRKAGVGSAVLDDIKQFADKNSKRVILTAGVKDKHWGTTSQSRLDQFYRRNGFVANKGRNKDYSITATHYYDEKPQLKESVDHPMIMLDGVPRHMNNSEGKPIHQTQEGIYNFHRWFGKSKAVDEHGRPKVFYHGTGADFDSFSHTFTGTGNDEHGSGFYFTDKPDVANSYATSHIVPVYLKLTKPIDRYSEKSLTRDHIEKMIKGAPNHLGALHNFGDPAGGRYNKVLSYTVDQYAEHNKFHAMSMLHRDFYHDHKKFLDNFKKVTGHDGILVKDRNIATVFHSNQIKSAIGNDGTFDHPTKITEENMNEQTTNFYDFSEWKKAAKRHNMTIRSAGEVSGTLAPTETFYADHKNEAFGGVYHLCKKDLSYFNSGHLTHPSENNLKEDTMNNYTPKDSVMAAYKQVISESNDEELSTIWRNTANQPWHEYMKTVKGVSHAIKQQQGEDSAENEASKKRVNDYLTKYKHLF